MRLSKSKVYELALSSIKAEHVDDFMGSYIPKVFPIMAEYGGKFLINGMIQRSMENRYPARTFALLEWPSIDVFVRIGTDQRTLPLIEERNLYLDFILEGCFYSIPEDIDFQIPPSRVMRLLLSNRSMPGDQAVRFEWIEDHRNNHLAAYLYFSDNLSQPDERNEEDIENYMIQIR